MVLKRIALRIRRLVLLQFAALQPAPNADTGCVHHGRTDDPKSQRITFLPGRNVARLEREPISRKFWLRFAAERRFQ